MKTSLLLTSVVAAMAAATALGQNPIANPTFAIPSPYQCPDLNPPNSWSTAAGSMSLLRNQTILSPGCGSAPYGSFVKNGPSFRGLAYQSVALSQAADGNTTYAFTGDYHGGCTDPIVGATASFYIYDGDNDTGMSSPLGTGTVTLINGETASGWTGFRVTAKPLAGVRHLIVAFGVANNPGLSGNPYTALHVHAVDLQVLICSHYWADFDNDGDVDMNDFAAFQRCYTFGAPGAGLPGDHPYCQCFDQVAPYGQIDEQDLPVFLSCVGGPRLPVTRPECQMLWP